VTGRRVVLALESSGPGGAEQMLLHLAAALRRAGEIPILATLRPGWMTERAAAAGIPCWIVPQRAGLDLAWIVRFARRLRRERVAVLHTHEFAMNIFGGVAALLARVPALSTLHGRHWVTARPRRARAYRWLHRLGIPVVAVADDLADFLAAGLGLARGEIEVVPNGIPVPALPGPAERAARRQAAREALGVPAGGRLAVCVGNLYPVKDHATLLRALPALPGLRLAIAGRGPEERPLRALATGLGVAERVHLLGLRDDVERVLAAADVFVHPSRSEGLSLAILEAMAAALPVVATAVGGTTHAVEDGATGLLVPPGDPGALARALASLFDRSDAGASLGAAGHERCRAAFSVEAMARRYCALYDAAVARRTHAP
jgi:glycosyltransferase involved in cell wall biosynthesis